MDEKLALSAYLFLPLSYPELTLTIRLILVADKAKPGSDTGLVFWSVESKVGLLLCCFFKRVVG